MAERRMFAKSIVFSDAFLDMPLTARCLYFSLGMVADDDGFVNNYKSIIRQIGASFDDFKLLAAKSYIICFEDGVIVIKHWRINNYLQNDRHKDTKYTEDLSMLSVKENGAYRIENTKQKEPCIQNVYRMYTQDSIDKVSIDKNNITVSKDTVCQTDVRRIVEAWNGLTAYGIKNISKLDCNSKRYQMLVSRVKQYSVDDILTAIENVKTSDFLQGKTKAAWVITFDWFVRPNNFPKVLEGNYNHGSTAPQQIDNDGWQ